MDSLAAIYNGHVLDLAAVADKLALPVSAVEQADGALTAAGFSDASRVFLWVALCAAGRRYRSAGELVMAAMMIGRQAAEDVRLRRSITAAIARAQGTPLRAAG